MSLTHISFDIDLEDPRVQEALEKITNVQELLAKLNGFQEEPTLSEKEREKLKRRIRLGRRTLLDQSASSVVGYADCYYERLEDIQEQVFYGPIEDQDENVSTYVRALNAVCAARTQQRQETKESLKLFKKLEKLEHHDA